MRYVNSSINSDGSTPLMVIDLEIVSYYQKSQYRIGRINRRLSPVQQTGDYRRKQKTIASAANRRLSLTRIAINLSTLFLNPHKVTSSTLAFQRPTMASVNQSSGADLALITITRVSFGPRNWAIYCQLLRDRRWNVCHN